MMTLLDTARDFYMANGGFEVERGAFKRAWENLLDAMSACTTPAEIDAAYNAGMAAMRAIEIRKPENPVKIGLVGEIYTVIDEHSNLGLDEKLMSMGVEVHRMMNFSNRYTHYNEPNLRRSISEYVEYDMGPTSTMNLAAAKKYAQDGFDGLIHAKCAGCTPEIDVMVPLRNISADFKIPVLYLTYDTETSDTGLMTRLEAFYDMLAMRH
jgi:predicted nucleotide-binding protein (sugar kinase/HSP70/actin superfamily)